MMSEPTSDASRGEPSWPRSRAPEDLIRPDRVPAGSLLVLAPHPDDEVLATGGLILTLTDRGDPVRVVFLTDGSRGGYRSDRDVEYVRLREREACDGLAVLGVRDRVFYRYPDRGLEAADDLAGRIAEEIDRFRPTAVTVPAPFEIHPDHLAAGAALARALRSTSHRPRILLNEIGAPHVANWILDVTELMDRKKAALSCHRSQIADNDFVDKMLGLNRYRTVNCGEREVRYAEAYLEILPEDLEPLLRAAAILLPLVERRRPSASWFAPGRPDPEE
jgi:LmbE family N-acetylglucosaminyl deacetylase